MPTRVLIGPTDCGDIDRLALFLADARNYSQAAPICMAHGKPLQFRVVWIEDKEVPANTHYEIQLVV